jgi:hypothetical protein
MTVVYDPVCHGSEHAPFNAALLATVLAAFPGEPAAFFGEAEHSTAVRALLDPALAATIAWNPLTIAPRGARTVADRLPHEWRVVSRVLRAGGRASTPRLIACAVTHVGLVALMGQLTATRRPVAAAVVHHSGLASTLGSRSTAALLRWTARGRIRHVVLGISLGRMVADAPRATSVRAIRHPYLFPAVDAAPWRAGERTRFGFLGLGSMEKGFDGFCRIAAQATTAAGKARATFELVGRLDARCRADLMALDPSHAVTIASLGAPLPRDDYERRARGLTYAVLPYQSDHFLASSGAVLDAFAFARPCLALRTPLFEEYFRDMGDIGYLCDREEELAAVVERLAVEGPDGRYVDQQRNIIAGRRRFTPGEVAHDLRRVLQ